MKRYALLVSAVTVCTLAACLTASGEVVRFQNGLAPTKDYAGCIDTRVSVYNAQESKEGGNGKSPELLTYDKARRVLVRFDLTSLPKDAAVSKALLRVYLTTPTDLKSQMTLAVLTHEWDDSATGLEFKKTDDDKSPEGDWAKPGGEFDEKKLLTVPVAAGAFGHAFEFDLTELVAEWSAGKRANCGVVLWSSQYAQHTVASAEWPVAQYRPELLVELGGKGELKPWPAQSKTVTSAPAAGTPDVGKADGPYGAINFDKREGRTAGADAYVKTLPKLAGAWGWMPMLRVGGGAGDFNATLLSYDLGALKEARSIGQATLRLYVADGTPGVRFGAYLARSDAPAWDAETVTAAVAKTGAPWPKDNYRAAFEDAPVSLAAITTPPKGAEDPRPYIEWDLTGAVRACAGKPMNLLLAHDVEGGALTAYSSRYDDPRNAPALEIRVFPAMNKPTVNPPPWPTSLPAPSGDYWVEPMKEAHKRFKGTPGTLGQYGDSITITMAFLAPYSYGKIVPEKCPPEAAKRLEIVDAYVNKKLLRDWKDPKYGNNGSMTVAWAFANIDKWQEVCKPEVTVILFGTNDVSYGPYPPVHTEMMAHVIDKCLADGTIPILTTLPPRGDQKTSPDIFRRVQEIRRAQVAIARARKIPLIDFYTEIVSRQPENWDKVLMGDSLHPSFPKAYQNDFTEEGLKNSGYTLRSYLTFMKHADIIEKVIQAKN